jgi:putative photosynthetic complex assembly protein
MSDTHHPDRPRIHHDTDTMVPRVMVRAMFALVMVILALTTLSVLTKRPLQSTPPPSAIVREVHLHLTSDISGAVTVLDAYGSLIADLSPESGGFVSGVHRVVLFERRKAGLPATGPVTLQAFENGRMAITDPATGWRADLMGFGADNAAAFARLLAQSVPVPAQRRDGDAKP